MTATEWTAEVRKRVGINEGDKLHVYMDTAVPQNPTIGEGFNLNRSDAAAALAKIGADYELVRAGLKDLTQAQVDQLFAYSYAPIVSDARASLASGVYDKLTDARRFVICDIVFNMGAGSDGWGGFGATHALLAAAVHTNVPATAHALYGEVAAHLTASSWIAQTGNRARRGIAMMRSSNWCDPNGDGSDVL